jgi:flagellar export protein FliJ
MKRFGFPLQRVLEWRSEQAEAEEVKLRRLLAEKEALESEQRFILAEQSESGRALIAAGAVDALELRALDLYRAHLKRRALEMEGKVAAATQKVEAQRARLVDARRNHKLLEKLKERAQAQWHYDMQRELEDLAGEAYLAQRARELVSR